MDKTEILYELKEILARMETIEDECKGNLKGYADGAADLAIQAIAHTIDLASVAVPMSESKTDVD